jgi:hypothetical protein
VCREHRSGVIDHSDRLWRLLNLELWHRVFIDRDSNILASAGTALSASGAPPHRSHISAPA